MTVQEALSFCEDCEDVVSLAMSAVQALMLKHGIDPSRVGRCGAAAQPRIYSLFSPQRTASEVQLEHAALHCILLQPGALQSISASDLQAGGGHGVQPGPQQAGQELPHAAVPRQLQHRGVGLASPFSGTTLSVAAAVAEAGQLCKLICWR
jgi:hypothetical protein